jgi:hypothetical protein
VRGKLFGIEFIITTTIVHAATMQFSRAVIVFFFLVFLSGDERHVGATCVCHCHERHVCMTCVCQFLAHFCISTNNTHSFFVFVSGDERRLCHFLATSDVCV